MTELMESTKETVRSFYELYLGTTYKNDAAMYGSGRFALLCTK